MKISLILMAVLLAVVPVLGLSAPSASADEAFPPTTSGSTLFVDPSLSLVTPIPYSEIYFSYVSSTGFSFSLRSEFLLDSDNISSDYFYLSTSYSGPPSSPVDTKAFAFYRGSTDISTVSIPSEYLSIYESLEPNSFYISDYSLPFPSDWTLSINNVGLLSASFTFDSSSPFSFVPYASDLLPEDSFVGVWGETAEFVGDIFIQVGDLFYDDTAEELTPIGTLAVILAGIAVVLLVWNLIRSFLPMRG